MAKITSSRILKISLTFFLHLKLTANLHLKMDGWMMSFHGDRKSPNNRVVGPLPNHLNVAYKWGY